MPGICEEGGFWGVARDIEKREAILDTAGAFCGLFVPVFFTLQKYVPASPLLQYG